MTIMLNNVWFTVNELLEQDPSLDEFNNNVNNKGEDSIFRLLRDTAEDVRISGFVTKWAPLFLDDMFYSTLEDQAAAKPISNLCIFNLVSGGCST